MRWVDPTGRCQAFITATADFVPGVGITFGPGVFADLNYWWDSGFMWTNGFGLGQDLSAGIGGGYAPGTVSGTSASLNASAWLIGGSVSVDRNGLSSVSGNIGVGDGISLTQSTTHTLTLADIGMWFLSQAQNAADLVGSDLLPMWR